MNELIQWHGAKYWDKPWNPIVGCEPVSPACEHCYAKAIVNRFNNTGVFAKDFKPTWKEECKVPKKGVIFCGNMTDLFGEFIMCGTTEQLIAKAIDADAGHSVFLWLTKRAKRMMDILNALPLFIFKKEWLSTHYFGFTAENQEWFKKRIVPMNYLKPEFNTWISCEPLLGPIDLSLAFEAYPRPKWIVVGCESGRNRRPCRLEWVESIVEQCRSAGVPVFVKQLDLGGKCVNDIEKFPPHLRIRQVPWTKKGDNHG